MKKRLLSIALVLCMLVSLLPAAALADNAPIGGSCGKSVTWALKDGTLTISGTGEMADYEGKSGIPWYKYANDITSIIVENGVTKIGSMAFQDCVNAAAVSIPASVKVIGKYSFAHCGALESVVVPEGVETLGDHAFDNCYKLVGVTLPKSLRTIGMGAFKACAALSDITLPYGVKTISYEAFADCRSLKSITVPESVTSLGSSVFANCEGLESVTLNCPIPNLNTGVFSRCYSLKTLTVPSTVKTIRSYAFEFCSSLKSIKLPLSLKTIEENAFFKCFPTDIYYAGTADQWNAIDIDLDTWYQFHGVKFHYNCAYEDVNTFTLTTAAGKPKLSWRAVEGADRYWIYRSTDGKSFKYWDSTTKTTYTNSSATIGTTYYYKVKAIDKDNNNKVLNTTAVKSIQCRPAAPSLSIYRVSGKPQLKWKAVDGASKYWIYRSTDGESYSYYDSTTKLSYTNNAAKNGTKYYYKVKAVAIVNKKNVPSAYSNSKNLLTSLGAPYLNAWSQYGHPLLVWQGGGGEADKYWIYRSTDGKNFKYYDYAKGGSYEDWGAKLGVTYYYKVKAICASNSNANSAFSKTMSVKITPDLTDISVKLVDGKPQLSWKAPILGEKYWIYRSTDGKNFKYYDCTTKTSYHNKATTAGTTYYYKIKSVIYYERQNIASDFSNTVSIKSK